MQKRVDVVGLVRSMKGAGPDVNNAKAHRITVVGGNHRARARGMQARLVEAGRTPQGPAKLKVVGRGLPGPAPVFYPPLPCGARVGVTPKRALKPPPRGGAF